MVNFHPVQLKRHVQNGRQVSGKIRRNVGSDLGLASPPAVSLTEWLSAETPESLFLPSLSSALTKAELLQWYTFRATNGTYALHEVELLSTVPHLQLVLPGTDVSLCQTQNRRSVSCFTAGKCLLCTVLEVNVLPALQRVSLKRALREVKLVSAVSDIMLPYTLCLQDTPLL